MNERPNEVRPGGSCEEAAAIELNAVYQATWTESGLAGPDGGAATETHWYAIPVTAKTSFLVMIRFDQQVEVGWHKGCDDDSPLTDWLGPISFDGDMRETVWPIQATFFSDKYSGTLAIALAGEKAGSYQFKVVIA